MTLKTNCLERKGYSNCQGGRSATGTNPALAAKAIYDEGIAIHVNIKNSQDSTESCEFLCLFYQLSGLNGSSSLSNVPCPLSQMISPQLDGSSVTSGSCGLVYSVHLREPAQMLQVSAMMVVVIGHIYLFFIVCRF